MEPFFHQDDHILIFNCGKIKMGDVIVFKLAGKNYIKRVDKLVDNYVYVSGDNKRESSKIGPIKKEQVVGKVILKY